ncbi:hypothetical protein BRYFOR_09899 [Marvinbryantia formatexigens DSM 14469]|uniref:Uncharacterized protein n=2 Tax=Marvinbryantia TaxID=248744 RepID=C6LMJ8_9FIRM|nr:hypothetical protein [Marvinbryantia formatexigens]EET58150.1 hypothetical protein BRYFOR_09899 [Marvinbryantia formatexigens DSM 14469]
MKKVLLYGILHSSVSHAALPSEKGVHMNRNLNQEQREKLTLAIQAAVGILVIGLSIRNSARIQTAEMKKLAKKDAAQQARLQKNEYAMKQKLQKNEYSMKQKLQKQKYRAKLQRARKSGKRGPLIFARTKPLSGRPGFSAR